MVPCDGTGQRPIDLELVRWRARFRLTFKSDLLLLEIDLATAERMGALVRFRVDLEEGEQNVRQLWLRPDIARFMKSTNIDSRQRAVVKAALRRFATGGRLIVLTRDSVHRTVATVGDIRELKGPIPPIVEFRFRPPKYHLRLFGRCIGLDRLLLTSYGVKSTMETTSARPLNVSEHVKRCTDFFRQYGFDEAVVPKDHDKQFLQYGDP